MIKGKKTILCAVASILFANAAVATIPTNAMQIEVKSSVNIMEVYNASNLNVRKGPGTSYSKLGSLKSGQTVEVLSISNGWAKINYKNGTGYVSAKYLKNTTTSTPSTKKEMIVKVDDLSVRKGAGTKYTKLGSLNKGDKVTVVSTLSSGWVKIEFNGGYGYVSNVRGAYLEEIKTSNPSQPSNPNVPSNPSTPESTTTKYLATSAINLRKTASWSGDIIVVIKKGDIFDVISISNDWAKVNYNGHTGYVPVSHIEKVESSTPSVPNTPSTPNSKKEMIVKVDDLSVRKGAGTKYTKLGALNKGEKVTVIEELSNGWIKIEFKGGYGYVSNVKGAYLEEVTISYDEVREMINNLNKTITITDEDVVKKTRIAYDSLSDEDKILVGDISYLTDAESEIESIMNKIGDVINLIDTLPTEITLDHKQEVIAVREAFNRLSVDEQKKIAFTDLGILEAAEAKISALEKEQANKEIVESLISRIESLAEDTINIKDHETEIKDIRAKYEALEYNSQSKVTNYEEFLRIELDLTHIYEDIIHLEWLIELLPDVIERTHGASVEQAKKEFNDLGVNNQYGVKSELKDKLNNAIEQANALKEDILLNEPEVKAVAEDIEQLPSIDSIGIDDKVEVYGLVRRYVELPEDVKFAVDTTTLEDAFDKIESIMVQDVIDLIDNLPSVNDLNLTHSDLLDSVRAKYDEISSRNNAKVTNINKLTELESKMLELKNVNPVVIEIVNKIKDLEHTVTFENIDSIKAEAEAIDILIDSILESDELNGTNDYDLIVNIAKFEEVLTQIDILDRVSHVTTGSQVEEMINALPEVVNITWGHGDDLTDIKNAYIKISDDEKHLISDSALSKLKAAIDEYNVINDGINEVISAINKIPSIEDLTLDDEQLVIDAKNLYDSHNEKVTYYVNFISGGHLENAIIKIAELKNAQN